MSEQFVRIPVAALHATDRQLGTVALKATAAWLLSIPGYRAPHGGIKEQLHRYFRRGCRFQRSWQVLNRCHLHLLRGSVSENRFCTMYDFSMAARPGEGLVYLRSGAARRRATVPCQVAEPVRQYVPVPVWLLKDPTLSVTAKAVVILALEELALAQNVAGYVPAKASMISRAGVPASSFEAAWKEAKVAGYIIQQRVLDEQTGLFSWSYAVAGSVQDAADHAAEFAAAQQTVVRKSDARAAIADPAPATVAATVPERQSVRSLIEENIGLDALLAGVRTKPLYYTAEDLREYVQLMVDTVCSKLPTVRIGRQEMATQTVREVYLTLTGEHILYVISSMQQASEIRNPLAYKRTALYNAAATYGEYAMGRTA